MFSDIHFPLTFILLSSLFVLYSCKVAIFKILVKLYIVTWLEDSWFSFFSSYNLHFCLLSSNYFIFLSPYMTYLNFPIPSVSPLYCHGIKFYSYTSLKAFLLSGSFIVHGFLEINHIEHIILYWTLGSTNRENI